MAKRMAFVIKLNRCVGCRTCTVSCKMENQVPFGVNRMQVRNDQHQLVFDKPIGTYPNLREQTVPIPCQHCENPPCVTVCPTGASRQREDGVVYINHDTCIGCSYCVWACPYGSRFRHPEKQVADKCDMCRHRLDEGQDPMCVTCCPGRALMVGDLNDPTSEVHRLVNSRQARVLLPEKGTKPHAFYLERG